jgi:hypothetical protein
MQHPEYVTELILRGVFLGRKKEVAWTFQGQGANYIFPEGWEEFISWIPESERNDVIKAYSRRLNGEMGKEGKKIMENYFLFHLPNRYSPDSHVESRLEMVTMGREARAFPINCSSSRWRRYRRRESRTENTSYRPIGEPLLHEQSFPAL